MIAAHLLGTPSVSIDGRPSTPPRGRKVWGLLAYLIGSERPVERTRLTDLLFAEANDPLGALRWNLAELRRLLGAAETVRGTRAVSIRLPPDAWVDVVALRRATWVEALDIPNLGSELLAGLSFPRCAAFESWLLNERRHAMAATAGVLREAVLAKLANGGGHEVVDLAARLVAIDPLEESSQELLIRSYAASGDRMGASGQLAACTALFRRELGVDPSPSLVAAASALPVASAAPGASGRVAAQAQLEAGQAAIGAGVLEPGLDRLRSAAAAAHSAGDAETEARSLIALGSALVHAARGRDEEGAVALHEAITVSRGLGRPDLEVQAHLPLAWADALRGRLERVEVRMATARALVAGRPPELADILGTIADVRMQAGRLEEAADLFDEAVGIAVAFGDERREASWQADGAACRWLLGDQAGAAGRAERSIALCRSLSWTALQPLPEVIAGLVALRGKNVEEANVLFEHAFALGCQIGDCCWEGLAQMGLGLVADARNDVPLALRRLDDARTRSVRESDALLFGHAVVLDALIGFAIRRGVGEPDVWNADLESLAARAGFRMLLEAASNHRMQLDGDRRTSDEHVSAPTTGRL